MKIREAIILRVVFVFTFLLFQNELLKSQTSLVYPSGYEPALDYEGKRQGIQVDMDGDTWPDLAIVLSNKENEKIIYVMRVGKYILDSSYQWFPWDSELTSFEFKNGTLHIASCFGNGRFCKTLLLKYYENIENMRLIGYEEESFGNSEHEGAYSKSVNLLTKEYEIGGVKKKFKSDVITLSNIEKYFDFLESIGTTTNNEVLNNNSQPIWSGKYVDQFGRVLQISEPKGREGIDFEIDITDENCQEGIFSGTVYLTSSNIAFATDILDGSVQLTLDGSTIILVESNVTHGARCSAEGAYKRK